MRLTWYSNAPWAKSGYGTQTAQVIKRLAAAGHEVAVAANYGLQGAQLEWEGIPIFPAGKDKYSNDVAPRHHKLWAPDGWMLTLYDVWGLEPRVFQGIQVASWIPVDHQPAPPAVALWAQSHFAIAMSQFGQRMLNEAGADARYIPHAIEPTFRPTELTGRGDQGRQVLGVPDDAFLIMVNGANNGDHPPRKGWGEMFYATSVLMQRHDDVFMYLHTDPHGYHGIDLPALVEASGLDRERVIFADAYALLNGMISDRDLAALYTASDVLLATSYGEGFGIPVIEAQACGTPVIVSDWTAQPELVGAGWKVPVQPLWDHPHRSSFGMPIQALILDALESAYALRGDAELGAAAIAKAAEYDADRVFRDYWVPVLAEMEGLTQPVEWIEANQPVPAEFYDEAYFTAGTKSNYAPYGPGTWADDLAAMVREFYAPSSVLDVGCAYGFVVKRLIHAGVDAYGFDVSAYAVRRANDERVWQGDATSAKSYRHSDLILASEVGEHLTEAQVRTFLRYAFQFGNRMLLLVGAIREGEEHAERHIEEDDLSHVNLKPISWWADEATKAGWRIGSAEAINTDSRSVSMAWHGRFLYLEKTSAAQAA